MFDEGLHDMSVDVEHSVLSSFVALASILTFVPDVVFRQLQEDPEKFSCLLRMP